MNFQVRLWSPCTSVCNRRPRPGLVPECRLNSRFLKVSSITVGYRGKNQASCSLLTLLSPPHLTLLDIVPEGLGPRWLYEGVSMVAIPRRHHGDQEHQRPVAKVGQDTTPSTTFLVHGGGGQLGTAKEEGGCPSQSPSSRAFSMSLQSVIWCGGQKGSYQRQPEI